MTSHHRAVDLGADALAIAGAAFAAGAHAMEIVNPYLIGASAALSIVLAALRLRDRLRNWRRRNAA
jgi:hypothetical protein